MVSRRAGSVAGMISMTASTSSAWAVGPSRKASKTALVGSMDLLRKASINTARASARSRSINSRAAAVRTSVSMSGESLASRTELTCKRLAVASSKGGATTAMATSTLECDGEGVQAPSRIGIIRMAFGRCMEQGMRTDLQSTQCCPLGAVGAGPCSGIYCAHRRRQAVLAPRVEHDRSFRWPTGWTRNNTRTMRWTTLRTVGGPRLRPPCGELWILTTSSHSGTTSWASFWN